MANPTEPKIELARQDGSKKFEIGIYNEKVRKAVETMEPVKDLDPGWADLHWVRLWAQSSEAARKRILQRYPTEQGFVVTDIIELSDPD